MRHFPFDTDAFVELRKETLAVREQSLFFGSLRRVYGDLETFVRRVSRDELE